MDSGSERQGPLVLRPRRAPGRPRAALPGMTGFFGEKQNRSEQNPCHSRVIGRAQLVDFKNFGLANLVDFESGNPLPPPVPGKSAGRSGSDLADLKIIVKKRSSNLSISS